MSTERIDPDRPLLPAKWAAAKAGDDKAVAWLVERYHWLALKVARAKNVPPHFDREDVVSWANWGLFDAVRKFKPEANTDGKLHEHFIGFGTLRIHGAILDGMKAPGQSWATREVWRQMREMKTTTELLEQSLGRPVTRRDVAEQLGVPESSLPVFQQQIPLTAVGTPNDDDIMEYDFFHDPATADASAEVAVMVHRVAAALAALPEESQEFLAETYLGSGVVDAPAAVRKRRRQESLLALRDVLQRTQVDPTR